MVSGSDYRSRFILLVLGDHGLEVVQVDIGILFYEDEPLDSVRNICD